MYVDYDHKKAATIQQQQFHSPSSSFSCCKQAAMPMQSNNNHLDHRSASFAKWSPLWSDSLKRQVNNGSPSSRVLTADAVLLHTKGHLALFFPLLKMGNVNWLWWQSLILYYIFKNSCTILKLIRNMAVVRHLPCKLKWTQRESSGHSRKNSLQVLRVLFCFLQAGSS